MLSVLKTFVTLSAKAYIVRTTSNFFLFSQHYLKCLKSGYLKFHLNLVSSFEVIVLDSRTSKKINFIATIQKINYRHFHLQP